VKETMKLSKRCNTFFFLFMLALFAMLGSRAAFAQEQQEAPDALIKRLSHEMLETIKSDKELKSGDTRRVLEVVENKLLPHVNFRRTTALTVGRHWRQATPEQQQQLIDEFRNLLIYTYSGALSQVGDQNFQVRPLRGPVSDTDIEIQTHVVQSGREPIQVNYRMEKGPEGWKIYDVSVFGAWLTEAYKNTFASEVNRGGIDGLIQTLTEKNRKLAGLRAQRSGG
jgi:phospholipid transport system substrate-binding protein